MAEWKHRMYQLFKNKDDSDYIKQLYKQVFGKVHPVPLLILYKKLAYFCFRKSTFTDEWQTKRVETKRRYNRSQDLSRWGVTE